jgi:hypothetical protein
MEQSVLAMTTSMIALARPLDQLLTIATGAEKTISGATVVSILSKLSNQGMKPEKLQILALTILLISNTQSV